MAPSIIEGMQFEMQEQDVLQQSIEEANAAAGPTGLGPTGEGLLDAAAMEVVGGVLRARDSAAAGPGNFRKQYDNDLKAKGYKRLPRNWDVHHRIRQFYRGHPDFANFDFDAPSNLRGVQGARCGTNIHQRISDEWTAFQRLNPKATGAQIRAFADQIDLKYANFWWQK